jgi:hypothetical protein
MSKRKRVPSNKTPATPAEGTSGEEPTEDAAVKDDMVHVTPDLLAGGPDIWAEKNAEASSTEEPAAAAPEELPAATSEPAAPEPPADTQPTEASTALTPEAGPGLAPEAPASPPPPYVNAMAYPAKPRRSGSSAAIGIVLVVVGIFALAVAMSGVDLTENGWPLFIIIPGLTLLVVGFVSIGAVATVPGGIVTMLGLVLAYANATGDWPVWAYAWSLVIPGGIGLGMYLQALRDRDQPALRTGRTLLFISVMIFLIGFVLFESILGISGRDYFGPVGKAALPALLIIVGVILLVRSVQRSRQAR